MKFNVLFFGLLMGFISNAVSSGNSLTFSSSVLSNDYCQQLLAANVRTKIKPVSCGRLRRVSFSYLNDTGEIKQGGELIVLDIIVPNVVALTRSMLDKKLIIFKE